MFKTNENPLVSIVIPTYNRASLIMETIDSILQQSWSNWELLVVDDDSTDDTRQRVTGIGDERIRYIHAKKTGVGIKLKTLGLQQSKGELFCFMDSDDCWAPDKLEKQIAALRQYPEAGFSLTGGYNFKIRNEPINYYYRQKEGMRFGDIFLAFFQSEASLLLPSIMFRKECLPLIYKYAESDPHSDVEFLYGLALNYKAVILYEPLLYRRLHEDNFTNENWKRGFDEGIHIIRKYKKTGNLPALLAHQSLFKLYINYGE
jgi:glycosyltransferase involved in cell wall biosynthesis